MREIFVKVQYVVAWAGCNDPLSTRTFASWPEALSFYERNLDKLSVRLEEYTTKTKVKILLPESGINK